MRVYTTNEYVYVRVLHSDTCFVLFAFYSSAKAGSNLNNKSNHHLVPSYNLYSEPVLSIDGQFEKIISPSTRCVYAYLYFV